MRHLSWISVTAMLIGLDRPEEAIAGAGLELLARRRVIFRAGARPQLALFTCGFSGDPVPQEDLLLRHEDGERTEAFRAVRRFMLIEAYRINARVDYGWGKDDHALYFSIGEAF